MVKLSYTRPTELEPLANIQPRCLRPVSIPPTPSNLPALPSLPRPSLLQPFYTLTTHFVPAAYPRSTPNVPKPSLPVFSPDKEKWKESVNTTAKEIFHARERQWNGGLNKEGSEITLWNCVNRYARKPTEDSGGRAGEGLTLFFAHANGFPKEVSCTLAHAVLSQV